MTAKLPILIVIVLLAFLIALGTISSSKSDSDMIQKTKSVKSLANKAKDGQVKKTIIDTGLSQATDSAGELKKEEDIFITPIPIISPSPTKAMESRSVQSTVIFPLPTEPVGYSFPIVSYQERLPNRLYIGPAFSPAATNKVLLSLDFDSTLPLTWHKEIEENIHEVSGIKGNGLRLGTLGAMKLADGEMFTYAGTLSFWMKMESIPTTGEEQVIALWNIDEAEISGITISFAGSQLIFSITDDQGNQEGIDPELKDPYSWHYIAATWDLTKEPFLMALYIDGQKLAETGFPFDPKLSIKSSFQLGGKFGQLSSAMFSIDELVLTNFAKSEEEVELLN